MKKTRPKLLAIISTIISANSAGAPAWGDSIRFDSGYDPSVAIRTDGLILDVHSNLGAQAYDPKLYYRIGKIDLSDGVRQTIHWFGGAVKYDGGYFPHAAINDGGQVVEAHEGSSWPNNEALIYRVGHLVATESGYRIDWDSGTNGVKFDTGGEPQIALDHAGDIVEVHHSGNDLHYRRGKISGARIAFTSAPPNGRYITGRGRDPSIGITISDLALEIPYGSAQFAILYRLSPWSP